jgi:hypothetical protein
VIFILGVVTEKIWFLGRGFDEYLKMFNLDLASIPNKKILDCPAGASSFTHTMFRKGYDVTAVDILYGLNPDTLAKICEEDFQTLFQVHQGMEKKVNWGFFHNSHDMQKRRLEVYKKFIEDYREGFGKRYLPAQLPLLPFEDDKFDLTLCSHFLFLYDDRLDYEFHLAALREMLRVTSNEIRIYPLTSIRGQSNLSPYIERVIEDLQGVADIKISEVDYSFRKRAVEMMSIIKRKDILSYENYLDQKEGSNNF